MKKKVATSLLTVATLSMIAGGIHIPFVENNIGIIQAQAAVGDVVTSDVQREINGVKYPADGSTITNTWTEGGLNHSLYSDGTFVVSGAGNMVDHTINKAPWNSKKAEIKHVVILDNVTSIGNYAFHNSGNLTDVVISGKLNKIGEAGLADCQNLKNVNYTKSIDTIDKNAFYSSKNLESIDLLDGLVTIGEGAFKYCEKLEILDIPDSATSVALDAFDYCTNLLYIKCGEGITTVPYFAKCTKLEEIILGTKVNKLVSSSFSFDGYCPNLKRITANNWAICSLFRDHSSNSNYKDARYNNVESVKLVGYQYYNGAAYYPFIRFPNIKELDISEATVIPMGIFMYLKNIDSIEVPAQATMHTDAFSECLCIKEVIFKNKFTNCGLNTCKNLEKIYMLGGIDPSVTNVMLPSTATVYCEAGSTVETWCKNNSVVHKTLSDEELDELMNGKRPSINQYNLLFDKESAEDLTFEFDLGSGELGAKSISNIIINGKKVAKGDTGYTISNGTVTLHKQIFETLPNDTYEVIVNFNNGYVINDKVKVIVYGEDYVLTPDKTVPKETQYIDTESLSDAVFTVYCESIDKVIINNKQLKSNEYELRDKVVRSRMATTDKPKELIIKEDFIATLKPGKYPITVVTKGVTIEGQLTLFITGTENPDGNVEPPIILDTIKYEFYKDYPDYLVIPFSYNRANKITEIAIENNVLADTDYEISKSTIVIDENYLSSLSVGKYRISVTFNDGTTRSNIQLIVYENAADRAAPYLLHSRIIFTGSPVVMNFDPGEGDLKATNILALVLDNEIILPNGKTLPFNNSNVNKIKRAFEASQDIDEPYIPDEEEATSSDADEATPSDADDTRVASASQLKSYSKKKSSKKASNAALISAMADLSFSSSNVFEVSGTEVTLDGDYVTSMGLSEGDHLIGAIFDNTEKTTDIKKVILTIEPESGEVPNPDDGKDDGGNTKPDDGGNTPDDDNKPDGGDTPDVKPDPTPNPDEGNKPDDGEDNDSGNSSNGGNHNSGNGGGGSHSGGSSGGGSSSNSANGPSVDDSGKFPDGSWNPDYTPKVPDSGGKWDGSGNDWTYTKPDGSQAKSEWVGDGEDWFYIDENGKLKFDWFYDTTSNKWYMLNRSTEGKFGAALHGWYFEPQDGNWYFLSPNGKEMLLGWQYINHEYYFFHSNTQEPTYVGDNISGWKYTGLKITPHGAMLANTVTPDGYTVNEKGILVK